MNNPFQSASEVKAAIPQGKTFTLVGGSFDLIHVGHLHVLEYAASLGDLLVVAILSDSYIQKYKDSLRPVINQQQRARMVASLRCVDFAYISDISPSAVETLRILKPTTVVFGDEAGMTSKIQQRIANILMTSPGTKVKLLPRYTVEEVSTRSIIDKIRRT